MQLARKKLYVVRCQVICKRVRNMKFVKFRQGQVLRKVTIDTNVVFHVQRLGARCQVPGVRCQVPGPRCHVPGVRCQVPDPP